ncbi:putative E3 ubiquitin-protein ligase HERC4 [Amphibalanus amphitrite]|uniref:Putative E3 ubiquitin-protein ligase HERC4 n=1 Tax=Amphibalanus amphitrite TaxID=1232801 RepID=A0A6A4V7D3_AMPAM|nr:probable E3 ubiquitin-protein ligase HERC4 [Amphibalanus amphitrite]XP_043208603.1 probable E3 ubiquitin-protein ligase HERC4 [Amphibalanus amphitrite]KAF0289605.1 putative E3 ubiquitin-protein ligase HERC4 [Amphibalanus amphitrite]
MYCWGGTVSGELGLGGIEEQQVRTPRHLATLPAGTQIVQVACGYNHTVFLSAEGSVFTCGNNERGQLGHSGQTTRPVLLERLENYPVAQVAAGDQFSLAVTRWGGLFSWGDNRHGQLGTGDPSEFIQRPRQLRALVSKRVVQAACGQAHCLVLTDDGELLSWGSNEHGQLGQGTLGGPPVSQPRLVAALAGLPLGRVVCGGHHCLAVTKCGRVLGWGRNALHQLGLSSEQDQPTPVAIRGLGTQRVRHVAAGENHSAALTREGAVFTFGAGMYGQLGHGGKTNEVHPRQVIELMGSAVSQLICGRQHTLAYVSAGGAAGGKVVAFGLGGSGQLGVPDTPLARTPVTVAGPWTRTAEGTGSEDWPSGGGPLRLFCGGHQSFAVRLPDSPDSAEACDDRQWPAGSQILELTAPQADAIREAARSSSSGSESDCERRDRLLQFAETALGSVACLSGSFLPAGPRHVCTSLQPNLDLSACQRAMQTLYGVTSEPFAEVVHARLAAVPAALPPRPADPEALRALLVLLCWPGLEQLAQPLGDALLAVSELDWAVLSGWLRQLPAPPLLATIGVFKAAVLRLIKRADTLTQCSDGSWRLGGRLQATLRVLRRLHGALLEQPRGRGRPALAVTPTTTPTTTPTGAGPGPPSGAVTDESFYMPELTDLVSVPLDYVGWQLASGGAGGDRYFCHFPFVFDAAAKTQLLQTDALLQMRSAMELAAHQQVAALLTGRVSSGQFLQLTVSRRRLVEDTLQQLWQLTQDDLKKPLRVRFEGEEGEDAGGVRKEFFLVLTRELLDPKYGMFSEFGETNTIWFNPDSLEEDVMYLLIGIVCGLAIYNSTIVNLPFPLALYRKLLDQPLSLDDLAGLSPMTARSLSDVLSYTGDDLEETMCLTFEVTRETFGHVQTIELKPGGSKIAVNQSNKHEYVDLYIDHMLNTSIQKQYHAFHEGFYKVCGSKVLQLFTAPELMTLVIGDENYDWQAFEQNAEYREGYQRDSPPVKLFWQVFHSLTLQQKKQFLLFLTGTDRVPITGMKSIKLYIQPARGGDTFLPVAHTCFNLLDLPEYATAEKLRYKLLQAIQCTEGFGLV